MNTYIRKLSLVIDALRHLIAGIINKLGIYGPRILGQKFYGKWFFDAIDSSNIISHPVIANVIFEFFKPSSVLEFGCGDCMLLHELSKRGVRVRGYEYSDYGRMLCKRKGIEAERYDFTNKTLPPYISTVDVVISLEVAEHIEKKYADFYCECLSKSNDAKILFFSAAHVGQTGEGHLNEQPPEYWEGKFKKFGWIKDNRITSKISVHLKEKRVAWYYWQNLQIFMRTLC
jgi:hypothetical protein